MRKSSERVLDTELAQELKRLKKIEKAHKMLLMEHEILKKASSSVRNEKRSL
jgi:hypothetical protein